MEWRWRVWVFWNDGARRPASLDGVTAERALEDLKVLLRMFADQIERIVLVPEAVSETDVDK